MPMLIDTITRMGTLVAAEGPTVAVCAPHDPVSPDRARRLLTCWHVSQ